MTFNSTLKQNQKHYSKNL